MTEEISAVSGVRGADPRDQAVFQLWQQQIDQLRAARLAAEAISGVEPVAGVGSARMGGDAAGLSQRLGGLDAGTRAVDLDAIRVPDELVGAGQAARAGEALAELGVVTTLSQVAVAFTQARFSPGEIAESLGRFATNMTEVAEQLNRLPGVGPALEVFGGVGGIVTGLAGLKQVLAETRNEGPSLARGLEAAASAARLVSGVAMALAPVCAPLAAVGGTIALAGAALELGKLGWEKRPSSQASAGATPIISNNGANMVGLDLKQPWAWLTG